MTLIHDKDIATAERFFDTHEAEDVEELVKRFPESKDSDIQANYVSLGCYLSYRESGMDHVWASMQACRRPPGGATDDTFFAGIPRLAEQFGSDKQTKRYVDAAKRHGYTPNPNDMYQPGLARFPGDPEAFVGRTQGRSYIKKLCERRGWACEGAVNVEARQPESDPYDPKNCVPMAKKLVDSYARDMVKANPDLKRKSRSELRQIVLDKHGPTT